MIQRVKRVLFGAPRNPMSTETRSHISLIAFFAWIGLGADGLSSCAYGPQEAYLALGHHHYLALYLTLMIGVTVFLISLSYNQVIELFPSGGGGYKVATSLLGPIPGLVSGTALILGYILTISMSIASGVDSLFSFFPPIFQNYKIGTEVIAILLLMYLNLRGMKESIKVFLPIFMGFVITHILIIVYGVVAHGAEFPSVVHHTVEQTKAISGTIGWFFLLAILMRAYSLGGGTYTGLEAVSNNVNNLAEPRVRTGKWTMLYMAISLSFTAGGILLLYLLWHVQPQAGKTLNAVVFDTILQGVPYGHFFLLLLLILEAGLLFVGANTGYLGGPAVLANMAIDGWVPRRFRNFSNRLVVQNGIVLFGVGALLILLWTHGSIEKLIILYSSSVFLTFNMSLLGLSWYWLRQRKGDKRRPIRFLLSFSGLIVCLFIMISIILTKFMEGGWLVLVINGSVIVACLLIKQHYNRVNKQVDKLDKIFHFPLAHEKEFVREFDSKEPTAVFFIGSSTGEGMHTLLWAQRMFASYFKNYIFVSVGIVDVDTYESDKALARMQEKVEKRLNYFVDYAHDRGIPAKAYSAYGTDHVAKLIEIAEQIKEEVKNPIFFAARVVLKHENWCTRQLHNETPVALQRNLHLRGMQMIILPVLLEREASS